MTAGAAELALTAEELLEPVRKEKSNAGIEEKDDEAAADDAPAACAEEAGGDCEEGCAGGGGEAEEAAEGTEATDATDASDDEALCSEGALIVDCTSVNSFCAWGRGVGVAGEHSGYVSDCIARSSIASISARFIELPGRTVFFPPSPCRMQRLAAVVM